MSPRSNAWAVALAVLLPCAAAAAPPLALLPTAPRGGGATGPVTEPANAGPQGAYIDWSARQLYAWGHGRAPQEVPLLAEAFPFAEQAAGDDARVALRQLLVDSELLGAPVAERLRTEGTAAPAAASRTTLRTLLTRLTRGADRSPQSEGKERADALTAFVIDAIEQALQGSRAAQTQYQADGSVQLQMRLPLDGGRGGLGEAWVRWRRGQKRSAFAAAAPDRHAEAGSIPAARPPTGIVVQARALGVTPTLWPRLLRQGPGACEAAAHAALYDDAHLSDEMLRAYGVAPFVRSIEAALRDPRVADRAMLVRAVGRCPDAPATLLIGDADADAIEAEAELLREGRVILVID